MKTKCNIVVM